MKKYTFKIEQAAQNIQGKLTGYLSRAFNCKKVEHEGNATIFYVTAPRKVVNGEIDLYDLTAIKVSLLKLNNKESCIKAEFDDEYVLNYCKAKIKEMDEVEALPIEEAHPNMVTVVVGNNKNKPKNPDDTLTKRAKDDSEYIEQECLFASVTEGLETWSKRFSKTSA